MRRKHIFPLRLILGLGLVCGLLLSGCGYSVYRHSDLPFTDIQIGMIENKTLEPKLQDKLYAALTEEFMKNGIRVTPAADTKLSAIIHTFDMTILSERQDLTTEYMINIYADFILEDKEGRKKELKNIIAPFTVSFITPEDLGTLLGMKELSEMKAMKDVAAKLVVALIYK